MLLFNYFVEKQKEELFASCLSNFPLRTGSGVPEKVKMEYARELLTRASHFSDGGFGRALLRACYGARKAAHSTACAATEKIGRLKSENIALPDGMEVWSKEENPSDNSEYEMSVCGFAFVCMKVNSAIISIMTGKDKTRSMNMAHRVPWAKQALRIDGILASKQRTSILSSNWSRPSSVLRIGNIVFPIAE